MAGLEELAAGWLRLDREYSLLTDPELVDQQHPGGVELVVADACGKGDQGARVVQRN